MTYPTILQRLIILAIVLTGIVLQNYLIISGDITWLMHVGKRLLAGGHYYENFVEVNPPMAIYIYLIPTLLSLLLHISFIKTVTIYIFVVAGLSWLACCQLLHKLFAPSDKLIQSIFVTTLAIAYFILPAYAFGQREYFLVLLTMPYLILAVLRLQNYTVKRWVAVSIGLTAGIGFAIKPYFLLAWLLIELYMACKSKILTVWRRTEFLVCFGLILIYVASIFLLTPQYITQDKQLINAVYYLSFRVPYSFLFTYHLVMAGAVSLFIYLTLRKNLQYQILADLLAISIVSSLGIFLIQQTLWLYHAIPIFMFTALLVAIFTTEFLQKNNIAQFTKINFKLYKTLAINFILFSLLVYLFFATLDNLRTGFYLAKVLFDNPVYYISKTAAGKPIHIFTNNIGINYPLIDYTHTTSTSLFPSLWLLTAAHKLAETDQTPAGQQLASRIADFVRTNEVKDIIKHKPVFIFVQRYNKLIMFHKHAIFLSSSIIKTIPAFDYINFFLQDPRFANVWQNYQYKGQAGDFSVYELKQ